MHNYMFRENPSGWDIARCHWGGAEKQCAMDTCSMSPCWVLTSVENASCRRVL